MTLLNKATLPSAGSFFELQTQGSRVLTIKARDGGWLDS